MRSRGWTAFGLFAASTAVLGSLDQAVEASCPAAPSNGDMSVCDPGDFCLWKHNPQTSANSNPNGAIQNYHAYCWWGETWALDNNASRLITKWGVSVTFFQNLYYNNGNPGGYACIVPQTELILSQWNWPAGGSLNDSLSSHGNFTNTPNC